MPVLPGPGVERRSGRPAAQVLPVLGRRDQAGEALPGLRSITGGRAQSAAATAVSEPQRAYLRARRIEASARRAHRRRCKRCGTWTLVGPDDDRVAMVVTVDVTPIDRVHAVAALLRGQRIYELDHHCLYYRDTWRARKEPEHSIHREHECEGH